MTDWSRLIRPQLLDAGPYVPGPSLDDLKASVGLDDVRDAALERGALRPPVGRARGSVRPAHDAWEYPEHAYLELREAIGSRDRVRPTGSCPGTASSS